MPKVIAAREKVLLAYCESLTGKKISLSKWYGVKRYLNNQGLALNEANIYNLYIQKLTDSRPREITNFCSESAPKPKKQYNTLESDIHNYLLLHSCVTGKELLEYSKTLVKDYTTKELKRFTVASLFNRMHRLPRVKGDIDLPPLSFSIKGIYSQADLQYFFALLYVWIVKRIPSFEKQVNSVQEDGRGNLALKILSHT